MSKDISLQHAEYVKWEKVKIGAKGTPGVEVSYNRLDGEVPGKAMTVKFLSGRLDEASGSVLKSLKAGDKFVVCKKKEGEYWNLDSFKNDSEWVEKPAYKANGYSKQGGYEKKPFDDVGVKVGAARNQAIAILGYSGQFTTDNQQNLEIVQELAYDIIERQREQEDAIRNNVPARGSQEQHTPDYQDDDVIPF